MKNKSLILALGFALTCGVCTSVSANNGGFHVVAAAGGAISDVSTNSFPSDDLEEVSYKLALGYELSQQWAFELAYQDMGDNELTMISDGQAIVDFSEQAFDVSAVQLSALGKASNRHGELFYRLGVMQVMNEASYRVNASECGVDDTLVANLSTDPLLSSCLRDNEELAGVIGIGFDFFVYRSLMLRLEMEYIKGEDDYEAQAAYVGFRLNF